MIKYNQSNHNKHGVSDCRNIASRRGNQELPPLNEIVSTSRSDESTATTSISATMTTTTTGAAQTLVDISATPPKDTCFPPSPPPSPLPSDLKAVDQLIGHDFGQTDARVFHDTQTVFQKTSSVDIPAASDASDPMEGEIACS